MSVRDVDGLNAGYAQALLEQYLENPEAVPEEWRSLFEQSGLGVDDVRFLPQLVEVDPWLARAGCEGEEAERVKELAAGRIENGWLTLDRMALKGVKA